MAERGGGGGRDDTRVTSIEEVQEPTVHSASTLSKLYIQYDQTAHVAKHNPVRQQIIEILLLAFALDSLQKNKSI